MITFLNTLASRVLFRWTVLATAEPVVGALLANLSLGWNDSLTWDDSETWHD